LKDCMANKKVALKRSHKKGPAQNRAVVHPHRLKGA
jgi:hypothetical protein